MAGNYEVHWQEAQSEELVGSANCKRFSVNQFYEATKLFEKLKEKGRTVTDIRLMLVQRFASVGG